MRQISDQMAAEYERIEKRAIADPGTAGDQGEENWAALLRDWLPTYYHVVTKGRIIGQDGNTSPQIDIIVLKSCYPHKLLNTKLYLAGGVAAAFECKTTLKATHIAKAVENCAKIKKLCPERSGTPYKELHSPIVFGLLAHSHNWKGEKARPEQNVEKRLIQEDEKHVNHPRQQLDLLCVADLGTWTSSIITFLGPCNLPSSKADICGPSGSALTAYIGNTRRHESQSLHFKPIGVLISYLSQKLAWEDVLIRDLADYYRITNIAGAGTGTTRSWPSTIYSEDIRPRVETGHLSNGVFWDEWSVHFE
jgi:hypothetical protein